MVRSALLARLRRRLPVARSWVRAWLAFSMPLGLIWGRPLSPLRRAISSRWAATVRSNSVPLTTSAITNALRSESDRASRSAGNLMPGINQKYRLPGISYARAFAPLTFPGAKLLAVTHNPQHLFAFHLSRPLPRRPSLRSPAIGLSVEDLRD